MAKKAKARPAPKPKPNPKSSKKRFVLLIDGLELSRHPSLKGAKGRFHQEPGTGGRRAEIQDMEAKFGNPRVWRLVEGEWQVYQTFEHETL